MDTEINRFQAFENSSLRQCRHPQFSLHFRAELPSFNVLGSGCGPNPMALKFKCKNSISKKSSSKKTILSSTWKIRHPEMRPGGLIAVPICYDGDWNANSVISLVFMIQNKKKQRVAYSKGEILLVDDLLEEKFLILMSPKDERSCEDLKVPVTIHLLIDVWDVDDASIGRRGDEMDYDSKNKGIVGVKEIEKTYVMYQRLESVTNESDECTWPESTDFLIEIPLNLDPMKKDSCGCDCNGRCTTIDENANLVPRMTTPTLVQHCVQFFCHQSKLSQESKVFEEMFDCEFTRDANVLRIRSFTPSAVEMFLNFIYTNRLYATDVHDHGAGISKMDFEELIQVVSLANRYEIDRLKSYCDSLLTDRFLNLANSAEIILMAERFELPLLGQAALSLLSWSMDEEYWQPLVCAEGKHLLNAVIKEARRKYMFCNVINAC